VRLVHYLRVAYKVISDFLLGSLRSVEQLKYFGLPVLFDSFRSVVDSVVFAFSSLVGICFVISSLPSCDNLICCFSDRPFFLVSS
jgi:hypothetical protein